MTTAQPIKIAILAMGGEGGGVLADWIVDLGERSGFLAQTTSVPGVAQRTGATIYYVELFPADARDRAGRDPILALMPMPGDVDIVLASELMEAGRAVQRGLVTAGRTTLIASTHRVHSIAEKTAMGDGRVDASVLEAACDAAADRFIRFDMSRTAADNGSVISAVLFGALFASGALPFGRDRFEATIEHGGVGVKPSLKAFDAAVRQVTAAPGAVAPPATPADTSTDTPTDTASEVPPDRPLPAAPNAAIAVLLARVDTLSGTTRALAREGVVRLLDYQDSDYARRYLDRLDTVIARGQPRLAEAVARHLAVWMSYEDTIRVADLKTRASRFARVRGEVRAGPAQVLDIDEFMHPRVDEICDTLPAAVGRWLRGSGLPRRVVERVAARGRVVRTTSLRGYLLLYGLAAMRPIRRRTLKYAEEQARIDRWLATIDGAADPAVAIEIARCQRLVKGYGDTHARGLANFHLLMAQLPALQAGAGDGGPDGVAGTLARLRDAALADEMGDALRARIAMLSSRTERAA